MHPVYAHVKRPWQLLLLLLNYTQNMHTNVQTEVWVRKRQACLVDTAEIMHALMSLLLKHVPIMQIICSFITF